MGTPELPGGAEVIEGDEVGQVVSSEAKPDLQDVQTSLSGVTVLHLQHPHPAHVLPFPYEIATGAYVF